MPTVTTPPLRHRALSNLPVEIIQKILRARLDDELAAYRVSEPFSPLRHGSKALTPHARYLAAIDSAACACPSLSEPTMEIARVHLADVKAERNKLEREDRMSKFFGDSDGFKMSQRAFELRVLESGLDTRINTWTEQGLEGLRRAFDGKLRAR